MNEYMVYLNGKPLSDEPIAGRNQAVRLFFIEAKKLGLEIKPLNTGSTWVLRQYNRLKDRFRDMVFTHKDARDFLKLNIAATSILFKELKQQGKLRVMLLSKDSRIRSYQLK